MRKITFQNTIFADNGVIIFQKGDTIEVSEDVASWLFYGPIGRSTVFYYEPPGHIPLIYGD